MALAEEEFQAHHRHTGLPDGQTLLFSPNGARRSDDAEEKSVHVATGRSIDPNQSRTRSGLRSATKTKEALADIAEDSPEEGEMRSDDDERAKPHSPVSTLGDGEHKPTADFADDSAQLISERSASPDNLVWRPSAIVPAPAGSNVHRHQHIPPPLTYRELVVRVAQLNELHGSLTRMHRVLSEYKNKDRGLAAL
jgi:hypothetical protein